METDVDFSAAFDIPSSSVATAAVSATRTFSSVIATLTTTGCGNNPIRKSATASDRVVSFDHSGRERDSELEQGRVVDGPSLAERGHRKASSHSGSSDPPVLGGGRPPPLQIDSGQAMPPGVGGGTRGTREIAPPAAGPTVLSIEELTTMSGGGSSKDEQIWLVCKGRASMAWALRRTGGNDPCRMFETWGSSRRPFSFLDFG